MKMVCCRSGSLHQGVIDTFGQGFQCTIIALVALLAFYQNSDLNFLFQENNVRTPSSEIDNIVLQGSTIYDNYVLQSDSPYARYLSHNELPSVVDVFGQIFDVNVHEGIYYGVVAQDGSSESGAVGLDIAIRNSEQLSNFILFTANELTISIFCCQNQYFIFDSHARNRYGLPADDGASVVIRFQSFEELITYLNAVYTNCIYNLSPITISTRDTRSSIHLPYLNNAEANSAPHIRTNSWPTIPEHLQNDLIDLSAPPHILQTPHNIDMKEGKHIDINISPNHSYSKCCNDNITMADDMHTATYSVINTSNITEDTNSISCINHTYSLAAIHQQNHATTNMHISSNHSYSITTDRNSKDTYTTSGSKRYFKVLKDVPLQCCKCCQKFLYPENIAHLKQSNPTSIAMNISVLDDLCSYCFKQIKCDHFPKFSSKFNILETESIPAVLKSLNNVEKRLIALIQVFMTIIQLPGGQFAERGSVINFLSPYIHIAKQLPVTDHLMLVRFANSSSSLQNYKHYISSRKVIRAIAWLKLHNHLYADIQVQHMMDNIGEIQETIPTDESCSVPADYVVPNVNISSAVNEPSVITLSRIQSMPVSPYDMQNGEEMAFPWLFPNGINGFLSQRPMKLTLREYFQLRMNNISGTFRKDIPYLLSSVNVNDYKQMLSTISIHMLMRKPTHGNEQVKARDIQKLNNNPDLLKTSYMFMKDIRGTAAFWKSSLSDLLAMLKSLGPPTLFITLSADDCHWPELVMTLTGCKQEQVLDYIHILPKLVKEDPYLTAIHFQRRYHALFEHILKSKEKPLGEIVDYFVRVEFQNRGSPHYHLFYWIKDVPLVTNSTSANTVIQYINRTITTCLPDEKANQTMYNLVKRLQTHRHSDYCMKNRRSCRFGFPFPPVQTTYLIPHVNVTTRGKTYHTRRTSMDAYINAYNPDILYHFQANMDIQVVNNAESAAYYVCAYLCKAEPDELKKELAQLIPHLLQNEQDLTVHSQLLKIGTCVLNNRRMSAQEAAFRISKLKLIQRSRNIVYVNCKHSSKRMKILKPLCERSALPAESTDIFHSNIIDYYYDRPLEMEHLSLYKFASSYILCSGKPVSIRGLPRFKLLHSDKWFRLKQKTNVIKIPYCQINSEDYYFSLLMLLLPHRCEQQLLHPFTNAKEALFKKQHLLDKSYDAARAGLIDQIEAAVRMYRIMNDEIAETFHLSSLTESEDIESENPSSFTFPINDSSITSSQTPQFVNINHIDIIESDESHLHSLQCSNFSEAELQSRIQQLTDDQRCVFQYVKTNLKQSTRDIRLFITGGAGVGKSFLLSVLADYISLTTPIKAGSKPVIVTAPTGTAAFNIRGQTLHSALNLPVDTKRQCNEGTSISARTLQKLRQRFAYVHTLIIDEISMVSSKLLGSIHEQLCKITNTDAPFGNMNIIAFGDFFQLRPIRQRFAFENTLLWHYFKPFILSQNMRQSGNSTFINLLNRARIGALNQNDINILKSRLVTNTELQVSPQSTTLHLFPKIESIRHINEAMLKALGSDLIIAEAMHYYSNNDVCPYEPFDANNIPQDDRDAGGLPNTLSLTIGCRVMLLRNLYTNEGLVNGALGKVHHVDICPQTNVPLKVYIQFDDIRIGSSLQQSACNNAIPIEPINQEFYYKGRCIIRRQFPVILAWAVTIHKSQGASLDAVYCSLGSDIFEHGMSYVALSRVRTLEGLHIYAFAPTKVTANPKVLAFHQKLQNQCKKK
jgi:hypothetical protein